MAVTFKSNQVAKQYIKDVSGYRGPKDFSANVSFADNLFVDSAWDNIELNSVLSITRSSEVSVLKSSDLNDYDIVGNNVPRVSYIPDYSTKGLISSTWTTAILGSPSAVSVNLNADGPVYALFTTDPTGSVTVTPNPNIQNLSGAGTFISPQYFKVTANTTVNLTRSGGAQKAHLMVASNGQTPFIPNYEFIGISPDTVQVNASKFNPKNGAVVFKFASPKRKYSGYTGSDQIFPLFLLKQDADNYVAAYINGNGVLIVRLYENGVQKYFVGSVNTIDRSMVNTVGVTWDNGRIKVAMNGDDFILFSERTMSSTFSVDLVTLAGALESWVPIQSNMAIFNIVSYSRTLDLSELKTATYF